MPNSRCASPPGRMKWCSSAASAVRVRRGSITTTLPPRLRIARSRPRMSGAVSRLPLETSGLAPRIIRWSVRSTSGTGIDSGAPNIRPDRHVLGHLVDGARREDALAAERADHHGPVGERRQVVRARVAHVHGHGVAPVLGQDGGEALVDHPNASSQVASAKLPSGCLTSGVRSRSPSSCRCLSPVALGQMKPWLKTSSSSPRTSSHVAALDRHLEPARGLAERTGAEVGARGGPPRGSLLLGPLPLDVARSRARASGRAPGHRRRRGRRPSRACARHAPAPTTPARAARRSPAPRRSPPPAARARSAGPCPGFITGALVGQSRAGQAMPGSSGRPGGHEALAVELDGEDVHPVIVIAGRTRSTWGRGGRRPALAAGGHRLRGLLRGDRLRQLADVRPRRARPRRPACHRALTRTASPSRSTVISVSSGGGALRVTSAPARRAPPPPARTCSRRCRSRAGR